MPGPPRGPKQVINSTSRQAVRNLSVRTLWESRCEREYREYLEWCQSLSPAERQRESEQAAREWQAHSVERDRIRTALIDRFETGARVRFVKRKKGPAWSPAKKQAAEIGREGSVIRCDGRDGGRMRWDGYASIFRHEPEEIEFIAHNAKTEIGPVRKYVNPYVDPCPE